MPTPSSPGGLFSGLFARGPVAAQVSAEALLQAMVDVELARSRSRALVRAAWLQRKPSAILIAVSDASALDIRQLDRSHR